MKKKNSLFNSLKKSYIAAMLVFISVFLSGCKENKGDYKLYYLNKDKTQIITENYVPQTRGAKDQVVEFINKTSENTTDIHRQKLFPDSVNIENYKLENRILSIYFNGDYNDMLPYEEVMCRGAIVMEFMQINGVDGVIFYVDNQQIKDANGMTIGMMNNDSFTMDPGKLMKNSEHNDKIVDKDSNSQNSNIEVIEE